jgi:hypothetical protein
MLKDLQTYFINDSLVEGDHILKILGSTSKVQKMATIYEQSMTEIGLIGAVVLNDWVQIRAFDRAELLAFKEGLAAIPKILEACYLQANKKDTKENTDE